MFDLYLLFVACCCFASLMYIMNVEVMFGWTISYLDSISNSVEKPKMKVNCCSIIWMLMNVMLCRIVWHLYCWMYETEYLNYSKNKENRRKSQYQIRQLYKQIANTRERRQHILHKRRLGHIDHKTNRQLLCLYQQFRLCYFIRVLSAQLNLLC